MNGMKKIKEAGQKATVLFLCILLLCFSLPVGSFADDKQLKNPSLLGEYSDADISWIIDKITLQAQKEAFCTVGDWLWDSERMLAVYRSGRPYDAQWDHLWHRAIIASMHQGARNQSEKWFDAYCALASHGDDMPYWTATDPFCSIDEREAVYEKGEPLDYADSSVYSKYLLFVPSEKRSQKVVDAALPEMAKAANLLVDNVMTGRPIISLKEATASLLPYYRTGKSDVDNAVERSLEYYAKEINEFDNTDLITLLCDAGFDPSCQEITLPYSGTVLNLSVKGQSLMAHLLSQLCDENGELVDREKALDCDSLAITYTKMNYATPETAFDTAKGLIALCAYERLKSSQCGFYDFSDISVTVEYPDNWPPEVLYYKYEQLDAPESSVIAPGEEASFNMERLFSDVESDELTYWASIDGGEPFEIELDDGDSLRQRRAGEMGLWEYKKTFYTYRHDSENFSGGHQTVTLTLWASDKSGESPRYTYLIEVYEDPSLEQLTWVTGEEGVTISNCSDAATNIVIPDTIEGKPVTNIATNAFYGCQRLKSLHMPDTVRTIGRSAFSGCDQLQTLNLPAALTQLGDEAFYNCAALEELHIPAGLEDISSTMFGHCAKLRFTVDPGNSVYTAKDGSVYTRDMKTLVRAGWQENGEFIIPNSVETVGNGAFYTALLDRVVFGKNVRTIGESAFAFCTAEEYQFNDGLERIGEYAFRQTEITNLNQMVIYSNKGESLNLNFVAEPAKMKELVFPESLVEIGSAAFVGTQSLERVDLSATQLSKLPDRAFLGSGAQKILLPDTLIDIGNGCFAGSGITEIDLPDGVLHIGEEAFRACADLTAIDVGKSLRTVDKGAFATDAIETLVFPATLRQISAGSTATVLFEGNMPVIGEDISFSKAYFTNAYRLEKAYGWGKEACYYPGAGEERLILHLDPAYSVMEIGEVPSPIHVTAAGGADDSKITWKSSDPQVVSVDAEGNVTALREGKAIITASSGNAEGTVEVMVQEETYLRWELNWDDTVTIIGMNQLSDFDGRIVIPETIAGHTVTEIGLAAFEENSDILSVSLPESIRAVKGFAFRNCVNLSEINFPESLEEIGGFAFAATSLTSVTLSENLLSLGHNAFSYSDVRDLKIDSPYLSDVFGQNGADAFYKCEELETIDLVNIPDIGQGMFSGCISLTNVSFPESLQRIDAYALKNCISLEKISFEKFLVNSYSYKEDSDSAPFYGVYNDVTVVHPEDGNAWDTFFGIKNGTYTTEAPEESGTGPRVFEVMRQAINDPRVLAGIGIAVILLILLGAIHRYRQYREKG